MKKPLAAATGSSATCRRRADGRCAWKTLVLRVELERARALLLVRHVGAGAGGDADCAPGSSTSRRCPSTRLRPSPGARTQRPHAPRSSRMPPRPATCSRRSATPSSRDFDLLVVQPVRRRVASASGTRARRRPTRDQRREVGRAPASSAARALGAHGAAVLEELARDLALLLVEHRQHARLAFARPTSVSMRSAVFSTCTT